jgi:hypothetical protein
MLASYGGARHNGTRPLARPVFAAVNVPWACLQGSVVGGRRGRYDFPLSRDCLARAARPYEMHEGRMQTGRHAMNEAGVAFHLGWTWIH